MKDVESSKCAGATCDADSMTIKFSPSLFGKANLADKGYPWNSDSDAPEVTWDENLGEWQLKCEMESCGMTKQLIVNDNDRYL